MEKPVILNDYQGSWTMSNRPSAMLYTKALPSPPSYEQIWVGITLRHWTHKEQAPIVMILFIRSEMCRPGRILRQSIKHGMFWLKWL